MGNRHSTLDQSVDETANISTFSGFDYEMPAPRGNIFSSCLPCVAKTPRGGVDEAPDDTSVAFKQFISKASSKSMHRRVTSYDVEVYVKNLFETSRAASSKVALEHHKNLTKNTSSLKKTRTIEAMHLDAAPFSTAALQEAAFSGEVEAVSRLVRQGYDVNERYANLETPLHIAAESGHPLMALELLHHGGDILAADSDGWTPLHHAALQGHFTCVETLINWVQDRRESGESSVAVQDILDAADEDGATPLHAAVHMRNYTATPDQVAQLRAVIKLLSTRGADVNRPDYNGWTPLHVAVQTGHIALVEELLELGANDQATDNEGKVALDYACNSKGTQFRSKQISRLLAGQAALKTPTERGLSPVTSTGGTPRTGISPLRSPIKSPVPETNETDLDVADRLPNEAYKHARTPSFVEPVDLAAALNQHLKTLEQNDHCNSTGNVSSKRTSSPNGQSAETPEKLHQSNASGDAVTGKSGQGLGSDSCVETPKPTSKSSSDSLANPASQGGSVPRGRDIGRSRPSQPYYTKIITPARNKSGRKRVGQEEQGRSRPSRQVVHYTKNGIPFVYDLEDEGDGTDERVSTTYQNPAFNSSAHPSIDWS